MLGCQQVLMLTGEISNYSLDFTVMDGSTNNNGIILRQVGERLPSVQVADIHFPLHQSKQFAGAFFHRPMTRCENDKSVIHKPSSFYNPLTLIQNAPIRRSGIHRTILLYLS